MSNILIIKHGSLGDLIQANGAMQDIKESFKSSKVLLLTSIPFVDLMSQCPYLDGVITDKRLPRWNIFYLIKLKKLLSRYNFTHIFDLQNSSRTNFYRKYLIQDPIWSSTQTILKKDEKKKDFDNEPVLKRMATQLEKSNVSVVKTHNIDLSWAFVDMDRTIKMYANKDYIMIFPFCSKKHKQKKWPYFKNLIFEIKKYYKNKYPILVAPGPGELEEANKLNAKIVLDKGEPIGLNKLITLINNAKFVISNDTGPAHICAHLKKDGLVLFGSHTTASKVSMETNNLKAISVKNLSDLDVESVMNELTKKLH